MTNFKKDKIMKKTYQKPTIAVEKIMTQAMIASSETLGIGGSYNGTDAIQSKERGSRTADDFDDLW